MKEIYQRLVLHFGSQVKTAKALGVKQPSVNVWVRGAGNMSPATAIAAEKATKGEFSRKDLCPKFPWEEI